MTAVHQPTIVVTKKGLSYTTMCLCIKSIFEGDGSKCAMTAVGMCGSVGDREGVSENMMTIFLLSVYMLVKMQHT